MNFLNERIVYTNKYIQRAEIKKNGSLDFRSYLKTHLQIINRGIYSTKFTHRMAIYMALFKTFCDPPTDYQQS